MTNQEHHGARKAQSDDLNFRSDLIPFPLDDELVLFSQQAQSLVSLNAPAAFVFRELQKGAGAPELARSLVSQGIAPFDEAERWVTSTLDALASQGMIADRPVFMAQSLTTSDAHQFGDISKMPPLSAVHAETQRSYRLLKTNALVRFTHSPQVRLVDAVLGHLIVEDRSPHTIVIDLQGVLLPNGHLRSDIYRNGHPIGYASRLSELAPIVKAILWQSAINDYDFFFYIHAGVVSAGGRCILLPAAAGSGKSSLTAALIHSGFGYFSDEIALIDRTTFRVPPMPLALCIKSTGWDVMTRYYPALESLPIHVRNDRKRLRYAPPPAAALGQVPLPVSHIIFPQYKSDAPTELKSVTRSAALSRLMEQCLAVRDQLNQKNVAELVRWIAEINCYALTFSSLDEAVQLIAEVN